MSNLLNAALGHAKNLFRAQSYCLHHKPALVQTLKESFSLRCSAAARAPPLKTAGGSAHSNYCTRAYDVNTNLTKDVLLFKYENPKFFKTLNIFAITQLCFWTYLSHFAYTTLKDAPVEQHPDEELAWYQRINLGDNKYRNSLTIFCFLIGYGIMAASWMYTLRSVRLLVLRKGGQQLAFVTYGPFNKNRIMTVPLKNVSAQESRAAAKVQLPIKVKNRSLFYILDMRGEFRNAQLFDYTAGLKRRL